MVRKSKEKIVKNKGLKPVRQKLGSHSHMLKTLHLAYQNVLDDGIRRLNASIGEQQEKNVRLTEDEQWELGRRLFKYWILKK